MSTNFRHPDILSRAQRDGRVSVDDLARDLGVTTQTIRRDLTILAEAGQLERVHGGAVLPSGTANIAYTERQQLNAEAKARIGQHCAALIPNDCCLYLSIGTTAEAVARALHQHKGLMVVTNNTHIAQILAPVDEIRVLLTGGSLRHCDGGLTGALTYSAIEAFQFDFAIVGCSAICGKGNILDYDLDEVQILQTALKNARESCLVADSSKFTRHAPIRIGHLSALSHVISDAPLPGQLTQICQESSTKALFSAENHYI